MAHTLKQSLDIQPKELVFKGPFDREVPAQLRLTNHTDKHICFKFKKDHCTVQPESGILAPGKAVVTAVIHPPFGNYRYCDINKNYMLTLEFAHITDEKPITDDRIKNFWKEDSPEEVMATDIVYKHIGHTSENALVVGIDIGNIRTKCTFSHASIYTVNPTVFWLPFCLCPNEVSDAYPTVVLLDDNKQLKRFGTDAIIDYQKDAQGHFFREVKKPLYYDLDGEDIYIKDELDRSTPAVKVLSPIIKLVKDSFIAFKIVNGFEIRQKDIIWVITVPAVFTAEAVSIVKNAALMAGIAETKLRIILEPEAALEYCFSVHKYSQTESIYGHPIVPSGKQFMIVDIGEETLDVTVIEKDKFGSLKELYKFCQMGYGGNRLHKALDRVLTTIVGPAAYQRFCTKPYHDNYYRRIHRSFEQKLKEKDSNSTERICLALHDLAIASEKGKFVDALKKSPFAGKMFKSGGLLILSAEFWQGMISEYSRDIIDLTKDVFKEQTCDKNMCIVLVGWYAELKVLQETFFREFPDTEILIPPDPQYATVKGAVLLGHRSPSKIERAHATENIIRKSKDGDVQDDDDSSLEGKACGINFVRRIIEMSKSSDICDDVVVHSCMTFQAGVTSLKLKMAGRPQEVYVKRKDIITDVITAYSDVDVHRPLKVHFDDEEEKDVTKEMFGLFWEKISNVWFQGENAVIPLVPVAKRAEARHVFPVLGKILEHTLCILGHFPPQICRSLLFAIAHPDEDVDADLVLEDYLLYLPERESELLTQSLKQTELSENRTKRLERFFSVNDFSLQPTVSSLKENLLNVAYAKIIDPSHVFMSWMGHGISDFAKAHVFSVLDIDSLKAEYRAREVTTEKVAQMVEAMLDKAEYSREERKIINYASNFVSDLSKKQLRQFLTWLTGSPNMPQKIEITFNTSRGLTKTSKVHRDRNILELSRDYSTYQDFKQDVMNVVLYDLSI